MENTIEKTFHRLYIKLDNPKQPNNACSSRRRQVVPDGGIRDNKSQGVLKK